ncbi:MAG TPA: YoaK family protein [Burkholderiales bacterium]|nr:YoaK family protein [Burkholderiales bacterium]
MRAARVVVRNALLLALTFSAGYVDALSYLGLGRVFTANMTGNTVLLGIAIAQLNSEAAVRSTLALAGFLSGAVPAAWIVERDRSESPWPRPVTVALSLEGMILAVFAVGWRLADQLPASVPILVVLSALAMGVQSAAAHRLEVSGVTTTVLTGTLINLAARLMGRGRPRNRPVFRRSMLLAGVWAIYFAGAAIAAVVLARSEALASALPPGLIMLIVIIAAVRFRAR